MTTTPTLVLATDAMAPSNAASESAFNLARRLGAKVLIVDTLREPSTLSRWFSSNANDLFEMVLADKQKRLKSITDRFNQAGVQAQSYVLLGKTSEAITQAVVDHQADLVIRYFKGTSSRSNGKFGNTSRNLMRICPCPVLFVNDKIIDQPNLLACINAEDEKSVNESILRQAESLSAGNSQLQAIYCWDFYGRDVVKSHVSKEYLDQLSSESERVHKNLYSQVLETIDLGKFTGKVRLEQGLPSVVIPSICESESIDVAVMCSASLNHPLQRYLGSTIESVLDELPCSLLVVKPNGFTSPIIPRSHSAAMSQ